MISASSAASPTTASTGPTRSTTQRKRQRLDQLVGRIAHLVGSAPAARISDGARGGPSSSSGGRNCESPINNNNHIRNNKNHRISNNNNHSSESDEADETDEDKTAVIMADQSASSEDSPAGGQLQQAQQQQQSVICTSLSRLRMRGNLRHLHLHHGHHHLHHQHLNPHHHHGQVFSFDHVHPQQVAANSDDEEEVFSPGLTPSSFSDRLTLSPCSQSSCTVDSPSGISFSPLSFNLDDGDHHPHYIRGVTRSLTSDPSTPLNLSVSGTGQSKAGITPPHASSSPRYCSPAAASLLAPPSAESGGGNRRRARSDSDLRPAAGSSGDEDDGVDEPSAAQASWVLTPSSLNPSPPSQQQQQQLQHTLITPARLSTRLEHLRPPPLMVSLKRNSSDSTDSWSPLFGQQESPVDLSVRSASSISSDSPNQTGSNTSTASVSSSELSSSTSTSAGYSSAGLETPSPKLASLGRSSVSSSSSSRGSRLKVLTRSISLSHYLSVAADLDIGGEMGTHGLMAAPGFPCEVCGQVFNQHDRLVKHLASRHKAVQQAQQQSRPASGTSSAETTGSSGVVVKGYQCEVCQRPFARSDMLTRHMRLHTGLKPYTCRICGQVFSRSDHLSTHQRTHTGEKPYRCPQCSYAACRRDMITRHLRTHTRSEDLDGIIMTDPR